MNQPKILYHGTTMLRWSMIKKDGLLRCNMPKYWKPLEYLASEKGYVFLSPNTIEATMYGLEKSGHAIFGRFRKNYEIKSQL